jgi:transcriptional regulator with XRE-family HTH domain
MAILNGKTLKAAREKKGWTQVGLSEATTRPKIDVSTISRIERGKRTRVRTNTLKALTKALDMLPENLCVAPETERDVMKLRVEAAARNALTLVALRYRISRESIVEIAPLLFFIAAEQCLQERQKRIAQVSDAAACLLDLYRGLPHLPVYWPIDENAVGSEEQSIGARDLFGKEVIEDERQFISGFAADFDEGEQNPFVKFLRDSLTRINSSPAIVASVRWASDLWPIYQICTEEAANIVGNDERAARAIVSGAALLHEMPKGSPEQKAAWARAEADRRLRAFEEL